MPAISNLPSATPTDAGIIPVVQSGVTSRTTLADIFNTVTGFTQSGTDAVARTVRDKLRDGFIHIKDFGGACDGTTNDAVAFEKLVNAAISSRKAMLIEGDVFINTAKSFVYSGDLQLFGLGNARLLIGSGVSGAVAIDFQATTVLTTTLASDATLNGNSIVLTSVSGVEVGQLIRLSTSTAVDASFGYVKQAVFRVAAISGTTVYLSEKLNFGFTTAETTVTVRAAASLSMSGVSVKQQTGVNKRFDLTGLQDCRLEHVGLEGRAAYTGDVLFLSGCYNVTGRWLNLKNGQYTINVSNGTRNVVFEDIAANGCRHPIDCNTWAYNVVIRRLKGINTEGSIECHPCFEVHFEDCEDLSISTPTGGIGLRCIGGSVKRTRVHNTYGVATADSQGPNLTASYQSLAQSYKRVYEDIESTTAILGAGDVGKLEIRRCKVPNISVDGTGSRIGSVSIDTETTITESRMTLSRVPVLSPSQPVWVTPTSSFASTNTLDTITDITQANPAVVTAAAHGLSNGDIIRIDGVVGMTQVNESTFTVANVTANTFELSGVNSTGYTAYSSGGVVALGRMAQTIDPLKVPGLGWSPNFHARSVIRRNGSTLNPATSVTIPVKVINNYGIQEDGVRHVLLTVRAVSSSDGHVVNKYQVYMFTGSPSGSSISTAQAVVPAISTLTAVVSNFRHHFFTEVSNEGGSTSNDAAIGEYYYSFDVVVTANSTSDRIQYVEIEVEEIRTAAT